jgi:hypothetical protein
MEYKSVGQIIEEVCEDICDNYCKYTEQAWDENGELSEICTNCPLNKLH